MPEIAAIPSAPGYFASSDGRWRLVGANGEVTASGESYVSKSNALRAIRRMKNAVWKAVIA